METSERLMTTQEAAEILGFSVSTVKRLVESGELVAEKTPGGHRRISSIELQSFVQRKGHKTARILPISRQVETGERTRPANESIEYWRESLYAALLDSRVEEARHAIKTVHGSLGSASDLGDRLIAPVMYRIGHGWQSGTLEIYQEHLACHMLSDILFELVRQVRSRNARMERGSKVPLAIGATPEGDHYTLSGILCELSLLEQGWDVRNLGCHLPLVEFSHAITELKPRIAWMSVHFVDDETVFAEAFRLVLETCRSMRSTLVVGGRAVPDSTRRAIVENGFSFSEDLRTLVRIANELHSGNRSAIDSTGSFHRSLHDSR